MLRIRIVTGGAVVAAFLLVGGSVSGGALAQTATGSAPGAPLQLLQNLKPTSGAKTGHHTRTAARSAGKIKTAAGTHFRPHLVAERKQPQAPTQIAAAAPTVAPENASSSAPPAPATEAAIATAATMQPGPALGTFEPSELVVDGQEVKVATPDNLNEIDLAAPDDGTGANDTQPAGATTVAQATSGPAAAPKAETVAVVQQPTSQVGSAAWIMQVLAALGGAVAAGSVAWFLIGSTPQRTYG